jgi:GntR family transcriptional regulator, transcriptional repressor for pyruvate dehydrogenase complex
MPPMDPLELADNPDSSRGLYSLPARNPTSQVARLLLSHLVSGRLSPGDRLPAERKLAEALGVGRSAIREALAALDLLGIVTTRQGSGSYLNATTSALLPAVIEWGLILGEPQTRDLVEARRHLEILLAGIAAERATLQDVGELRESFARMRDASGDLEEFVEADVSFHLKIAQMAGNGVLANILHSISALLRVWIARAISADHGHTDNTMDEHAAVLAAIAAGDGDLAAEAMTAHMDRAGARLDSSLGGSAEQV